MGARGPPVRQVLVHTLQQRWLAGITAAQERWQLRASWHRHLLGSDALRAGCRRICAQAAALPTERLAVDVRGLFWATWLLAGSVSKRARYAATAAVGGDAFARNDV
eukprot:COSAG02_NODE_1046_length_14984_cov_12.231844_1_plen_107_part_00